MSYARAISINCFKFLLGGFLAAMSRGINKELALRNADRGHDTVGWFTPEEAITTEALANMIVPSDEETPGIDEVDVLGPPALVMLGRLVATSPDRQGLYSRGLLGFDTWALKQRGCRFAELPKEDQASLFGAAQQIYEDWAAGGPAPLKAWRRLRGIIHAGNGSLFAAQLCSQIRDDCLQVFYTSGVSWVWLDYDGPPMDEGYPSVTARR